MRMSKYTDKYVTPINAAVTAVNEIQAIFGVTEVLAAADALSILAALNKVYSAGVNNGRELAEEAVNAEYSPRAVVGRVLEALVDDVKGSDKGTAV
jgi:hypothetical protein